MLLFTRQAVIRPGKLSEAMQFAMEVADHAGGLLEQEVTVNTVDFGAPMGTIVWATNYESIDHQTRARRQLMGDTSYVEMVDRAGSLFLPGIRDVLYHPIHRTGDPTFGAAFTEFTTATITPGKVRQAIEFGSEILEYGVNLTGLSGVVATELYGRFAQLSWFVLADEAAGIDDGRAKRDSDPGWLERLGRAGQKDLFLPGSGRTSLSRRIH